MSFGIVERVTVISASFGIIPVEASVLEHKSENGLVLQGVGIYLYEQVGIYHQPQADSIVGPVNFDESKTIIICNSGCFFGEVANFHLRVPSVFVRLS